MQNLSLGTKVITADGVSTALQAENITPNGNST